ncbi:MAG: type II secretion system protein [Flavobacteriaceae bacterium]|nr:type II secretion system protein [Flavobacteriaceae bacterium]
MKIKKVDAFTLSELLVVLVISGIVISITFLALQMVQKQLKEIQVNYRDQQEIQLFERVIVNDLNTRKAIFKKEENHLIFYGMNDSISYTFERDYFIREKDTFKLKIVNKKFLLDAKEITSGRFDAASFKFSQSFSTKEIFVYSVKDSEYYMNQQ